MNRGEVRERIKLYLGFKQGTAFDDTIITAIQQAQQELEREAELPFFLKKHYSGIVTAASTQSVNCPSDFLREFSDDQLFIQNTTSLVETPVVSDAEGEGRLKFPSGAVGVPELYTIINKVFYFYPTPDDIYNITGTYFASAANLTDDNTENNWTRYLPEILYSKAGFILASGLRDMNGMQLFAGMLGRATQKLNEMNTADQAAGSKPVIGGED